MRTTPQIGLVLRAAMRFCGAALAGLIVACSSAPPPPEWQGAAFSALNSFTAAYLEGNTRVAEFEFKRAQSEVARTGRTDLMARLVLVRCAAQVASLEPGGCAAYDEWAPDAVPAEQNYADLLAGRWQQVQPDLLPPAHQGWVRQVRTSLVSAAQAGSAKPPVPGLLTQIPAPQARLMAAALLLKTELLTQADIELAIDTASNQGWRRPLLAWLGVQRQRALAAGDLQAAAAVQRRMDLVLLPGGH